MNENLAAPAPAANEAAGAVPAAAREAQTITSTDGGSINSVLGAPIAPPDNSVTASDITGDAPAASDTTPSQPAIDTSDYDTASSYEPSFKDGVHVVKGVVS